MATRSTRNDDASPGSNAEIEGAARSQARSHALTTTDEIALLEKLLAEKRSANQNRGQLSENGREEADGGTDGKESDMCRIDGPFERKDRKTTKYRLRVVDRETGKVRMYSYGTREEALAAVPALRRQYRRPVGIRMSKAMDAYEEHLSSRGNVPSLGPNKPRTIETTMGRLRAVFTVDVITGDLTAAKMIELWQRWIPGKATDTALNTLNQVRTFLKWLAKKEWTKRGELTHGIEVVGKRRKGKPKLTQDEAKRLVDWCIAHPDDPGAVATALAFVLGMRASEIANRTARHLDGNGTLLDITDAKTEAGERTLKLPRILQPLLARLARGKKPDDRLFGDVNRHWVLRSVKRCCAAAGVAVVTPHGLRGTHAKVAREVGVSGVLLAAAMGHESETTTTEHYAGRGAVAQAAVDRVAGALN
jgi:integrase